MILLGAHIGAVASIVIGLVVLNMARTADEARVGFALVMIGAGITVGSVLARLA